MPNEEKQVRAIVAFGDIIGFGSFVKRINYPETEFRPFIREFDALIDKVENENGLFIKRLGDGFMCVVELPIVRPEKEAIDFLDVFWKFAKDVNKIIQSKPSPRPEGFRFRMVCGYVWKLLRSYNRKDYLGYLINLAEKMIHIEKNVGIICHESMKELIEKSAKRKGYIFKKLNIADTRDVVYREDLNLLWILTKKEK